MHNPILMLNGLRDAFEHQHVLFKPHRRLCGPRAVREGGKRGGGGGEGGAVYLEAWAL